MEGRHDAQFIAARIFDNRSTSRRGPALPLPEAFQRKRAPSPRRTGRAPSFPSSSENERGIGFDPALCEGGRYFFWL
jgi:hypothetical protein